MCSKKMRLTGLLALILAVVLAFPAQTMAAAQMPLYTIVGKNGWYFSDFDGSIGETYKRIRKRGPQAGTCDPRFTL